MIILILFISFAYAEPSLVYMKNDKIDLKVPCEVGSNHSACSSGVACNISITYPNSSYMSDNAVMTHGVPNYNYTLPSSSVSGTYNAHMYCTDGTNSGFGLFQFKISSSGQNNITPLTSIIALGIMALIMIIIAYILGDEHWFMKIFMTLGAIFCIVLGIPATLLAERIPELIFRWGMRIYIIVLIYVVCYPIWWVLLLLKKNWSQGKKAQ